METNQGVGPDLPVFAIFETLVQNHYTALPCCDGNHDPTRTQ